MSSTADALARGTAAAAVEGHVEVGLKGVEWDVGGSGVDVVAPGGGLEGVVMRSVGGGVGEEGRLGVGVERSGDGVGRDVGVVWHCGEGGAVGEDHAVEGGVGGGFRAAAALGDFGFGGVVFEFDAVCWGGVG